MLSHPSLTNPLVAVREQDLLTTAARERSGRRFPPARWARTRPARRAGLATSRPARHGC